MKNKLSNYLNAAFGSVKLEIYNTFLFFSGKIQFFTPHANRLYLKHCCDYLTTDNYGNNVYQARNWDDEFEKVISVSPEQDKYLVNYLLGDKHLSDDYLDAATDSIV